MIVLDVFEIFCQLLAMIGEQFDYGDEICGAVVSIRGKQERIAVWTKNAANETAQVRTASILHYIRKLTKCCTNLLTQFNVLHFCH